MTLSKALKKKNRLAQKIKDLQLEIQQENSRRADDPRKVNVEDLLIEFNNKTDELIKLKIAMFVASTPMRENILRLGELKSKIIFLKSISTVEGKISNYGDDEVEYSAVYDRVWVKKAVGKCEEVIDMIQDELDIFNHLTAIEI